MLLSSLMMLSFVVLVAAVFVPIEVYSAPQNIDLDALLDIIQTQKRLSVSTDSSSSSSSDSVESESTLRSKQLINLLHQTIDEAKNKQLRENKQSQLYKYKTYDRNAENNRPLVNNRDDVSLVDNNDARLLERFLEGLLMQNDNNNNQRTPKKKAEKRKLKPSTLMEPFKEKNDVGSLSEYSRVYVILNPDALSSSQNQKQLTNLISRLLASSSPASQKADRVAKEARYKTLSGKGLSLRRSRRESSEAYIGRSSREESKKRPRYSNYNSYGGGGAGGRTAIPVVRNRGDIYVRERD